MEWQKNIFKEDPFFSQYSEGRESTVDELQSSQSLCHSLNKNFITNQLKKYNCYYGNGY
jgi:hypothetical protein